VLENILFEKKILSILNFVTYGFNKLNYAKYSPMKGGQAAGRGDPGQAGKAPARRENAFTVAALTEAAVLAMIGLKNE
jgi:hypothetical protein